MAEGLLGFAGPVESSLVVYLVLLVLFAAGCFYLGYRLPYHAFQGKSQAAFVLTAALLIPATLWLIWAQATAHSRLSQLGIGIAPELGAPHGVLMGHGGTWMFEVDGTPMDVLKFYRQPQHTTGWKVVKDTRSTIVLSREQQRLTITSEAVGGPIAVFTLEP